MTAKKKSNALPYQEPVEIHHTDLGNSQQLVLLHGSSLHYCYPRKKWYIWDQTRWKVDDTGRIYALAINTVHVMYHRAQSGEAKIEKGAAKHAEDSEASRAIDGMVKLARSGEGIAVVPLKFDVDPWLLNLQNGVLNLKTGELGKHDKKDLITKIAAVSYDAEATCPLWDKFLSRVLNDNIALIEYLRRAVGYSLTGDTSEHALFFLYGKGQNGKTTFLRTLQSILGDYACQADPDLLLSTNNPQHSTNIARLDKIRLTVCTEVGEGRSMRTSLMKQLTGGDKRTARQMREDFSEYQPTDKIWLGANNKPRIRGQELAIWRRIKLIPFIVTIPGDEQDKHLAEKLINEAPGILNWALVGCEQWQSEEDLNEPAEVKTATADYKSESDPLAEFITDCCIVDPDAETTTADLYDSYTKWAAKEGLKTRDIISHNVFTRRLGARFEKKKAVKARWPDATKKYERGFKGIDLITILDEKGHDEGYESPF